MPALQSTDLFLLSSIMQTLGALWGIVFIVYVLSVEYLFRDEGWYNRAAGIVSDVSTGIEEIPLQRDLFKSGGGSWPSATRRLRLALEQSPGTLDGLRRNLRVFEGILVSGVPVAASIIVDLTVIWSNDATYLGVAIWIFVAALLFVAIILSREVLTTVRAARKRIRELEQARSDAAKAYEESKATIPDQ